MAAQTKSVESSIKDKLSSLPANGTNHRIYKVPKHFGKVKRECYTPFVVSIGPIYYKKKSLKSSQELKLRHLQCFMELVRMHSDRAYNLGQFQVFLERWEGKARSFYADKISLGRDDFLEMLMVDAAFIICYIMLRSLPKNFLPINPMKNMRAWEDKVQQDLFLADNQLPFLLVHDLYHEAFGRVADQILFKELVCSFIGQTNIPGRAAASSVGRVKVRDISDIKDFVDFLRICCLPPKLRHNQIQESNVNMLCCLPLKCSHDRDQENNDVKPTWCLPCNKHSGRNLEDDEETDQLPPKVKELKDAGVKFLATPGKNLLDIKYTGGVLQIPKFSIQDNTEAILRSLIFSEQCHHYEDSYFIDYAFFLDALIDTPEDVQVLVQNKIIDPCLGSDDEVATIINQITTCSMLYAPNFYYSQVSRDLHAHVTNRRNKWRAILMRDYFNHPWSLISVVYLVLLLILTVLQVYTGFKG
ncbi:hypothetical protein BVRB_2g042900 [Beta vulgaris subsp. vulgaris]|nr:hypothetical protein BVRB_2g042900 [Beta vulgaris subsp. vulgaris]